MEINHNKLVNQEPEVKEVLILDIRSHSFQTEFLSVERVGTSQNGYDCHGDD